MDADAAIAAGAVVASAGCLTTSAPLTLAGVVVVLVGCAWGWAITRDPTDRTLDADTDAAQAGDDRQSRGVEP